VSVHLLGTFPGDAAGHPVATSGATASSWTALAESGLGSGPNATTAWALCGTGGPTASQVVLTTIAAPNGASGFATATATCPAGAVLLGGGANTVPGNLGNPSSQPSPLHLNGSYRATRRQIRSRPGRPRTPGLSATVTGNRAETDVTGTYSG